MLTLFSSGPSRLGSLVLALAFAVVLGGADGCSSDPNVEGAKLYVRSGEFDQAITSLDRALEADPANAEAYTIRADVRRRQADAATDATVRQGYIDQMAADIVQLQTLAPEAPDTKAARINGWALAVTKGNGALTTSATPPAVSEALFRSAVAILPDSSQGHYGLGLSLLRADRTADAIAPMREAVRIDPTNVNAHIYLGRALLLSNQTDAGIVALEEAADRFPDDGDIQATLLNAYAAGDRLDDALSRYDAVVARTPDDPLIRYNYGALLLRSERYDDAIVQLSRAAELDPASGDTQYNLGAAYQNKAAALTQQANAAADDATADRLIGERDGLLEQSLEYLLGARRLSEGDDERAACNALFQVYTQLNRIDDANGVAECAGISMN